MEQSLHNRVYINPNFKRTEIDSWRPPEQVKTTHFNRHFVEEIPNRATHSKISQMTLNNRKIYVNPNFINSNTVVPRSVGYIETNENMTYTSNTQLQQNSKHTLVQNLQQVFANKEQPRNNLQINMNHVEALRKEVNSTYTNTKIVTCNKPIAGARYNENVNIPNRQLLHKSKYSLIQNFQQIANKGHERPIDKEKSIVSNMGLYEITKKPTQEVALAKSRYCIIRKKKRLSLTVEQKNENKINNQFVTPKHSAPIASMNQLTCYANTHAIKNNEKNKVNCKTPDKVTKIKITKYKIVPANSLKKLTVVQNNENKSIVLTPKTCIRSNTRLTSSIITPNKNRFKFIKSSTPMKLNTPLKSSTPVCTNKVASRITQYIRKDICRVKVKLSKTFRTKFNVNNIPCRLFSKYGKCLRQDQGNCKYLHDKKHVSLCRRFLKGICHDNNCTLSHELTAKKMPTCYFYLSGMCTKDGCPYLHVKLSDKTKICQEFVKGYCESGDKCPFKHVNVKSSKTQSYKIQRSSQRKDTNINIVKENKENREKKEKLENCNTTVNLEDNLKKDDGECRYYKESVDDNSYETIKPKRCKLGTLPSFIQL